MSSMFFSLLPRSLVSNFSSFFPPPNYDFVGGDGSGTVAVLSFFQTFRPPTFLSTLPKTQYFI